MTLQMPDATIRNGGHCCVRKQKKSPKVESIEERRDKQAEDTSSDA